MGDTMAADVEEADTFDFDTHRRDNVEKYREKRGIYADYALCVQRLLSAAINTAGLKVQTIEHRAKTEESFGTKASRPLDAGESAPKYSHPLKQITDLAGCRVITFFINDVETVKKLVEAEFNVGERENRSSQLRGGGRPGYESFHFIVELSAQRLALPEYARFTGLRAEIQIRTILQHAWAEIEHDIQYKSVDALPSEIGKRFQALAGLIEIGDREFQAISDSHNAVRNAAAISLQQGRLEEIELTAESLKSYLDKNLGPDGRMRDWTYEWTATYLRQMGFKNIKQLDDCISGYDDDQLSRIIWGSRQGQLTRLELALLAGLGPERLKQSHPYARSEDEEDNWYAIKLDREIGKLIAAGIIIGSYTPQ